MKYTAEEVMQFVSEEDVKFIRLAFCDFNGVLKNVSIMPGEIKRAFCDGINFNGSRIFGETFGTLKLIPDPSTLAQLTWRPDHGRVVRMFCAVCKDDKTPISQDIRSRLLSMDLPKTEITESADFYLFQREENGEPSQIPFDNATYLDVAPLDKGENIRRSICLTLEDMDCNPISSYHSAGPGQNCIAIKSRDILSAADHMCTFAMVAKTMAAANNLYADFDLHPVIDKAPNTFTVTLENRESINFLPGCNPYLAFLLLARAIEKNENLGTETIDPVKHPLLSDIKPC